MSFKKALFLLVILFVNTPHAVIDVEVNKGRFSATPLGIKAFYSDNEKTFNLGKDISQLVAKDLQSAGVVSITKSITDKNQCKIEPNFNFWKSEKTDMVLSGSIQESGTKISIKVNLHDTVTKRRLISGTFSGTARQWRKLAHKIADQLHKRITGEIGYFSTQIAYVAESGKFDRRVKRLSIMDFDGDNHRFITRGAGLIMTPRFSPDGKKIIYFNIMNRRPNVYIYDLTNGYHRSIGSFQGMSYAPRFAPDGKHIIFSLAHKMVSSIYTLNLDTNKRTRLTRANAINTSPCISPDVKTIAFVSDRDMTPQIFLMNKDGKNQRRISYGAGRYFTPVWSPNGKKIAFTKTLQGTFYLGVMNADGSGERLLTQGYFVEGPSWAPNGKAITFTRRSPPPRKGIPGTARVYRIDIEGVNEKEIITPLDGTDPGWSPLLK